MEANTFNYMKQREFNKDMTRRETIKQPRRDDNGLTTAERRQVKTDLTRKPTRLLTLEEALTGKR